MTVQAHKHTHLMLELDIDGDHVAASANNQAGPPRCDVFSPESEPSTNTNYEGFERRGLEVVEAGMEELCQNYPA